MLVFTSNRCPVLKNHLAYRLAYIPDARKRHRKGHDKTWKCEEKRGSKEHRKGKGSSGHRREWSPDDSNDASAPPNLSDGKKVTQNFLYIVTLGNLTFASGLVMWSLLALLYLFSLQKNEEAGET